ncbi:MAG: flavin reductase family protein [Ruminococcaceae bacterium]|nr:flavin reductase family protein [Oscillospiraceae bacterium]
MSQFYEISPEQIERNPFTMIGRDWMLIGAESGGRTNAMTASWGGVGVLWNKNVVFAFIRPQRFTKGLVDAEERFSLTFLDESHRDTLAYFGKASGHNEDKIKNSGLTVSRCEGAPYFTEGNLVIICKKLYAGALSPDAICAADIDAKNYPEKDYHTMYVGEIVKVLMKVE